ncbi:nephrocystin-4 isoform X1 [Acipenser oxyrinchus oxyrinchus]|uniref:Nephrocystin-4 isoform X1 n=1 Tax=Acipenser oxyrinchus oxyrinchus TaxID=40147 RepID=A0AAD8FW64_ACIOX|nr:nephrocystin-4 isoform X1 [Acipenser oxyrinchus oxyrinchus]
MVHSICLSSGGNSPCTMPEWQSVFEKHVGIPPHIQRCRLTQERSEGFQLVLKNLEGTPIRQRLLEGFQEVQYQLRVSLFDVTYRHFFGRTWRSPARQLRSLPGHPPRVSFNEVVYFHTSLIHPNIVAVVEVVAVAQKQNASQHALSCGFGILRLFIGQTEPVESSDAKLDKRLHLYHGTPRALLSPELQDPIEKNEFMTLIEGAHIQCSLRPHPALERVMHLLPMNMLVSGAETIPGVAPPTEEVVDCLQKPRLFKTITCYLDKVSLSLYPSLERFEEELLELLNTDRLNREDSGPDGNSVVIQERRLHIAVHNGWGFVDKPQVVVVEPEGEGARGRTGSFIKRQGCLTRLGSSAQHVLVLRSRLQLKEMVNHPAFVITFQLEYVFSAPTGGEGKMSSTTSFSKTAYMQSVRWAVWNPFLEAGSSEVSLSLQGGPLPNPNSVMVYKATSTDMSSPEVKELERGTLRVRFSSRQEGRPPSPAPERKPPSSALCRNVSQVQDSPPKSPPGPGLSISQLSVSPRYPTISHSTASPWQQQFPSQLYPSPMAGSYQLSHAELPFASSIAHLEADLSCSAAQSNSPGAEQLQELPFNPVHAPIIALGTQVSSTSSTVSRSSLVRLHSSGFPEIVDCNNQAAEVVDPADPVNFSPNREESDYLQCNEIILQFLAFTRTPQEGMETDWLKSVYFTFQLYRFPPVTSQRLLLVNTDRSASRSRDPAPCILVQVNKDGTVNSGSPGLQLKYMVDPGFLKLGEQRWFIRYLALQTLQIDVWDAESLLLIGSSAVELKHLLRQGRAAVQVIHELEVITTEYVQDSVGVSHHGRVNAIGVSTIVKGTLHLRMGNVGHLSEHRLKHTDSLPPSLSRVVSSHDSTSSFTGGSLSSTSISNLNAKNASRARRLPDIDGELASMLCSRMKEASIALQHASGETGSTRQRKLERMMAVRQYEAKEGDTMPYIMTRRDDRIQHSRDLQIIEAYRERSKAETITKMLSLAITAQHTVYATLGTAEFFEFALKNPSNTQHTVTIECEDPELSVIVDTREWRHFKELSKTLTPLEEDMFHLEGNTLRPQVYLRPKETVYIPFKYQTFNADHAVMTQGPTDLRLSRSANVIDRHQSKTVQAKIIRVSFRAEDGKPLAMCQVNVEPTPHVIDQTFRFYHPELTFLKKSIRLPLWHILPGTPVGVPSGESQIYVRCSDPNVICETKKMAPGEPQDVFLKLAGGPSPQIKKFFITIFTDPWLAAPIQIWQFYIHCLQRVDVSCVTGQLTHLSLVLRGTQTVRKVKCYSSHPHLLQIDPADVFVLPPNAVQDLHIGVRPQNAGSKFLYLNVVDVDYHQLVSSWLVCVSCKQPLISKAFEISLSAGKGSNKKITYTNPYPTRRAHFLCTNRTDLLQFKEDAFEIGGGETYTIGLRFAPSQSTGEEEILIYINDQEQKNEETFCVKVVYS